MLSDKNGYESFTPRQNGIHGWKCLLFRDTRDEPEVHTHVAVGALARPDLAVLVTEAVQHQKHEQQPQAERQKQCAFCTVEGFAFAGKIIRKQLRTL